MPNEQNHPYIVALGASAGGLESLNSFFSSIDDECNYTFIVIQHLSPDHKSLMNELLAKQTNIPIEEIQDGTVLRPHKIYLIPPKNNLTIEDGIFKLYDKPMHHVLNLPIDILFESAAKQFKSKLVSVVLSGTGSDGAKGIEAVKKYGGLVIAQQPSQAKFDGMPQSAINTGLVDFILPTEEMKSEIDTFFIEYKDFDIETEDIVNINILSEIISLLHESNDLDFALYKKPTLIRRIKKRMGLLNFKKIEDYYDYLIENTEELHHLYEEILIGVTKFFRDQEAWNIVEKNIIPSIVASKKEGEILKIWDVGCSTGEETYTLAMLFHEELEKQQKNNELKVFATDISQNHLDLASKALYTSDIEADVSAERLSRFFTKTKSGNYKIKEFLRREVIFSNHNIIKDPPFKNVDLVVCRNLLIYLQSSVQQNVMHVLHYSLKENGVLFLGSSENIGVLSNNFSEINRKWNLFRNVKVSKRLKSEVLKSTSERNFTFHEPIKKKDIYKEDYIVQKEEDLISQAILDQFGAASVQIDHHYHIIEAKGELKKYLVLPDRGFTTNLLKMLPEDLKIPVTTSVNNAKRNEEKFVYQNILYKIDHKPLMLSLYVKPILHDNRQEFVITFIDVEPSESTIVEIASVSASAKKRIHDLEEELEETKIRLKRAIEDTETSNEELQAANEELLASNEELQSTNEELQSVNEELHTVNSENLQKMDDLALLNADINNLLNSTNIGTIFLNKKFRKAKDNL